MNVDTRKDGSIASKSRATVRASTSSPEIASDAANIRKQAMNRGFARLLFRSHPIAFSASSCNELGRRWLTLLYMAVATDSQNSSNLTAEKRLRVGQVTDMAELPRAFSGSSASPGMRRSSKNRRHAG
jgi:hypothetical protein